MRKINKMKVTFSRSCGTWLAAISMVSLGALATAQAAEAKPNILMFIADDLGYLDVSDKAARQQHSPNLDKFAAEGVSFQQAFVTSPACGPSRASLLTGQMPARTRAEANHERADAQLRKLPSYLQQQGYQVVSFGKVAHYGHTATYGFDHYAHDGFHDQMAIPAAINWLNNRKDTRPLAIFIGTNWPHVPWPLSGDGFDPAKIKLPAKTIDTPETRIARTRYHAAIRRMDQDFGDVLATAEAVLGRDALYIFSADNGAQWPFAKWNLYDTGTRVPFIVRWRGQVPAGQTSSAMVSWIDVIPTLNDAAGGSPIAGIDGQSILAGFRRPNDFAGRSAIFTTHNNDGNFNVYPGRAVRTQKWKLIENLNPSAFHTTHIDQNAKLGGEAYFEVWRRQAEADRQSRAIVDDYYQRPRFELFDLEADPDETHNLASSVSHQGILADLRRQLDNWRKIQGDTRKVQGEPHFSRDPLP